MPWTSGSPLEAATSHLGVQAADPLRLRQPGPDRGAGRTRADPAAAATASSDIAALSVRKARGRKAADGGRRAPSPGASRCWPRRSPPCRGGRLFYRGRDAARLARDRNPGGRGPPAARRPRRAAAAQPTAATPPERRQRKARLFWRCADRAAPTRRRVGVRLALARRGRDAAGHRLPTPWPARVEGGAIHERLGHAWGCDAPGMDLIRRALVLLADHELNASTFAARVAASTGASLAACALGRVWRPCRGRCTATPITGSRPWPTSPARIGASQAVAARAGARHGRAGLRPSALPGRRPPRPRPVHGLRRPARARRAARGGAGGDRGARQRRLRPGGAGRDACGLPAEAPFALFAVARCAGWLAHAIEQAAERRPDPAPRPLRSARLPRRPDA